MGGHNAWRKRVKNGLLAKEGGGGAICRHRPRLGRRGKDLILNRKGHILGGSNKKKKIRERRSMPTNKNKDANLKEGKVLHLPKKDMNSTYEATAIPDVPQGATGLESESDTRRPSLTGVMFWTFCFLSASTIYRYLH